MKPYKPKRIKKPLNDPAHRMMRQAQTKRTTSDKAKAAKVRKAYYKRNRTQILQRQKNSRARNASK